MSWFSDQHVWMLGRAAESAFLSLWMFAGAEERRSGPEPRRRGPPGQQAQEQIHQHPAL